MTPEQSALVVEFLTGVVPSCMVLVTAVVGWGLGRLVGMGGR